MPRSSTHNPDYYRMAQTEFRERQRRKGFRSTETRLHETEIAKLDHLKVRLALNNRSEAIRAVMAAVDFATITPQTLKLKDFASWDDETSMETP